MSERGKDSLPAATVLSVGAVTPLGRDMSVIARKLSEPAEVMDGPRRVSDVLLADPAFAKNLRRADRFTRMGVMAAVDAWKAAGPACEGIALERIGMILASGFGPHCRGFKFLDGLIDAGDGATSPTDFSHSVHGAACAYISALLDVRGPSLTVTDFEIGFEQAVQLGQCWLAEGACDRVLLGAVDELGEVMLYCAPRMLGESVEIRAGEGAMFMVLGPEGLGGGIARIDATAIPGAVDLLIEEQPIVEVEDGDRLWQCDARAELDRRTDSARQEPRTPGVRARERVSFTSHFGYSASGAAFGILGGLLGIAGTRGGRTIDSAATLRTSSDGRVATLVVERILD